MKVLTAPVNLRMPPPASAVSPLTINCAGLNRMCEKLRQKDGEPDPSLCLSDLNAQALSDTNSASLNFLKSSFWWACKCSLQGWLAKAPLLCLGRKVYLAWRKLASPGQVSNSKHGIFSRESLQEALSVLHLPGNQGLWRHTLLNVIDNLLLFCPGFWINRVQDPLINEVWIRWFLVPLCAPGNKLFYLIYRIWSQANLR